MSQITTSQDQDALLGAMRAAATEEFEGIELVTRAAVRDFAGRLQRRLTSLSDGLAKRGRCLCDPPAPAGAGELAHTNMDCPAGFALKIARVIADETE
jgi:hypothetical protein